MSVTRLCTCDGCLVGVPHTPEQCYLCWLYWNDEAYNRLWGGTLTRTGLICAHRGPEMAPARCSTCRGEVKVKTFACAVHGRCTLGKPLPGLGTCNGCPDRKGVPITKRNLLMHVMPVGGNGVWQANVEVIRRHAGLFNGRRVIAVVTGPGLDPPERVQEALGHTFADWIVRPNDPVLREVATFEPLFERIANTNADEATFYCQAKGVTRKGEGHWQRMNPLENLRIIPGIDLAGVTDAVSAWTAMMYRANLDYWPLIAEALDTHALAGIFKDLGDGPHQWYYRGTFFWLRHAAVFHRNWRRIDRNWLGMEMWPGLIPRHEGAGLFLDGQQDVKLYDLNYVRQAALPAFARWEAVHARQRQEWA